MLPRCPTWQLILRLWLLITCDVHVLEPGETLIGFGVLLLERRFDLTTDDDTLVVLRHGWLSKKVKLFGWHRMLEVH